MKDHDLRFAVSHLARRLGYNVDVFDPMAPGRQKDGEPLHITVEDIVRKLDALAAYLHVRFESEPARQPGYRVVQAKDVKKTP